jgi:hypothetical protein
MPAAARGGLSGTGAIAATHPVTMIIVASSWFEELRAKVPTTR